MEVLVVAAKGVSPDSVVSIRAAGTRRQGALSSTPGKPFKFPCTAEECTSIKVDVFAPVGTARAMCLKGVVRDCTLPLQAPAGHEGVPDTEGVRLPWEKVERVQKQVSIQVRPAGDAPPLTPEEQEGQERTAGYFEEHGVLVFLQGLLQDLIKDRPAAPFVYISDKALAFQPAPVPQAQVAPPAPEAAAPLLEEAPAATDPEATPLNDLKREAHAALLRGASTGELKKVLQSISKESVRARPTEEESEEEEEKAPPKEEPQKVEDEEEPPQAAAEERLSPGETVPDEPVPEAAQEAEEPSTAGAPPAPQDIKTQENEIERIRKEMRLALLQGVQNGGLQKALEDCHQESGHPAEVHAHQETAPPIEDLEEPAVDPVKEPPMDDLRGRARDALLESASGGHLDKVLAELRPSSREHSPVQPVPVPASADPSSVGTLEPLYSELTEMAREAEKLSNQVKEMKELVLQAAQENEKLRADLTAVQRSAATPA